TRPADDRVALLQITRVQDVALLAIGVMDQRDVRSAVRIVFDFGDFTWNTKFVALEIDLAVLLFGTAATATRGDVTVMIATAGAPGRLEQRFLGRRPRDLLVIDDLAEALARRNRLEFLDRHTL